MADDSRFIPLETKAAFHEDLLQSLNDTVVALQQRVDDLERRHRQLLDRVAALQGVPDTHSPADERPPHY